MSWNAYFHPKFKAEFDVLPRTVQDELLASLTPLRVYGPVLGRPEVDTLKGWAYANMKELRFRAEAFGALRLPPTQSGQRSCWWRPTNRG